MLPRKVAGTTSFNENNDYLIQQTLMVLKKIYNLPLYEPFTIVDNKISVGIDNLSDQSRTLGGLSRFHILSVNVRYCGFTDIDYLEIIGADIDALNALVKAKWHGNNLNYIRVLDNLGYDQSKKSRSGIDYVLVNDEDGNAEIISKKNWDQYWEFIGKPCPLTSDQTPTSSEIRSLLGKNIKSIVLNEVKKLLNKSGLNILNDELKNSIMKSISLYEKNFLPDKDIVTVEFPENLPIDIIKQFALNCQKMFNINGSIKIDYPNRNGANSLLASSITKFVIEKASISSLFDKLYIAEQPAKELTSMSMKI